MLKRDFRSEKKRWKEMELEEKQRRATIPAADDADAWGNDTVKTIPTSIQLQL